MQLHRLVSCFANVFFEFRGGMDCIDCVCVCLSRRPRAKRAGGEGGAADLASSAADLYQDCNIFLWTLFYGNRRELL